jgi:short-subunit dehydrogenase
VRDFSGKVCVVTGAASGIGLATARALAQRGSVLCLADIDKAALNDAADAIRQTGALAHTYPVDVSSRDELYTLADAIERDHGGCALLINNAGVMTAPAELDEQSQELQDWLLGINFWGVFNGTRAFLPQLRRQPEAHIVNVASLAGLVGILGHTHYCASKGAVRGLGEALRMDLRGTSVGITTVFPGAVSTQLVDHSRGYDEAGRAATAAALATARAVTPAHAAARILRAVERKRGRLLIGLDAKALDVVTRLAPEAHVALLHRAMKKYAARSAAPVKAG